jgi:hypothetical protein
MRGALPVGRPDAEMVRWRARCAQLFKQVVSDDDIVEIIETAVDRAKLNDAEARSWLSSYIFPKQSTEDSRGVNFGVDGNLNILIQNMAPDELRQATDALKAIDDAVSQRPPSQPISLPDPRHP